FPFFLVAVVYVIVRIGAIGFSSAKPPGVISNPYLYASAAAAIATKLAVLLRYLQLLFYPHPLSSDYSYQEITYVDFSNPLPWLSLAIHVAILAWGLWLVKKRDVKAF